MKTLYGSILKSTNSGKYSLAMYKYIVHDLYMTHPDIGTHTAFLWELFDMNKMSTIANKLPNDISYHDMTIMNSEAEIMNIFVRYMMSANSTFSNLKEIVENVLNEEYKIKDIEIETEPRKRGPNQLRVSVSFKHKNGTPEWLDFEMLLNEREKQY